MAKSAMIRARINPELKDEAESIFTELGLSITEALTLFYQQVRLNRGLPFEVRLPNAVTRKTMTATDAGKGIVRVKDADEPTKRLGI
jgi:DNA-damage-inducible protein J